eukprot:6480660-Amphidinium_carterae.1
MGLAPLVKLQQLNLGATEVRREWETVHHTEWGSCNATPQEGETNATMHKGTENHSEERNTQILVSKAPWQIVALITSSSILGQMGINSNFFQYE